LQTPPCVGSSHIRAVFFMQRATSLSGSTPATAGSLVRPADPTVKVRVSEVGSVGAVLSARS